MSQSTASAESPRISPSALMDSITIPPRPSLLADLQMEMAKDDPDFRVIANLVARDVGLSAALLRVANSPAFMLSQKADTVARALSVLGLRQVYALVSGFLARQAVPSGGIAMVAFWDASAKRALAMAFLARRLRCAEADQAYTFGLFCDLGMPLMMQRFMDYAETLDIASKTGGRLTVIETERHAINHAVIGGMLARVWQMPLELVMAIRLHHDPAALSTASVAPAIRTFVAMGFVADEMIRTYEPGGNAPGAEWKATVRQALDLLHLLPIELDDLAEEVHELFRQDC